MDIKTDNVVFVHGSIDPWHALGITKTLTPDAPAIYIKGLYLYMLFVFCLIKYFKYVLTDLCELSGTVMCVHCVLFCMSVCK